MIKYRIIQRYPDGNKHAYKIQKRFLFLFWVNAPGFGSWDKQETAEEFLKLNKEWDAKRKAARKFKPKVVYESE